MPEMVGRNGVAVPVSVLTGTDAQPLCPGFAAVPRHHRLTPPQEGFAEAFTPCDLSIGTLRGRLENFLQKCLPNRRKWRPR